VPDDQVRLDVRPGLERVVDAHRVAGGVFEGARAIVVVLGRPTLLLVLDAVDLPDLTAAALGRERAPVPVPLDQVGGDVPELGREVLVDKQDVHGGDV
jgi:hypothetical protein